MPGYEDSSLSRSFGPALITDRRRTPRSSTPDQLSCELIGTQPVVVRDIGADGIAIQCLSPVRVGEEHVLRLTTPDGETADVRARVVHAMRGTGPKGETTYVAGLVFVDLGGPMADALADMIDRAISALPIDED